MSQIKLDYLSATRVRGKDAETFLQGQLTADLTKLGNGEAGFAAFCEPNGNVLAVLLVIRSPKGMTFIAGSDLMNGLITEMSRFVLRADVQFERLSHAVLGCEASSREAGPGCFSARATSLCYCVTDEPQEPADPVTLLNWRARELRSGLVWLNGETSGQFIPQMLGLEKLEGLSFRKGCFPGQEVIARVRYLGKLKRRPVVVEVNTRQEIPVGTELEVSGKDALTAAAVVVDSVAGPESTTFFLVARIFEGAQIDSIRLNGQPIELLAPVQA